MLAKNETYGICTREHECCVDGPCNGNPRLTPIDRSSFQEELETLINKRSVDNSMDTPDYILARYLVDCLDAFNRATIDRDISRGRDKGEPCAESEYDGTEIVNVAVPEPDEEGMHRESAGTLSIGNGLITHQFKTDAEIDREIQFKTDAEIDREIQFKTDAEIDREIQFKTDAEIDREIWEETTEAIW